MDSVHVTFYALSLSRSCLFLRLTTLHMCHFRVMFYLARSLSDYITCKQCHIPSQIFSINCSPCWLAQRLSGGLVWNLHHFDDVDDVVGCATNLRQQQRDTTQYSRFSNPD